MSQARASEEASTSQAGSDQAARNKQLENIGHLTYFLINKFEGISRADESKNKEIDLDRSNIYAGFLSIIFKHLKKVSEGAARGRLFGGHICSYKNKSHSVSELALEFQEVCSKNGVAVMWDFESAETLVNRLTAFEMSWDETRQSASKFSLPGPYGQTIKKELCAFGLSNVHLPALTGLTYIPERRLGLLEALGTLTLAIMLSAGEKTNNKLIAALREHLKYLPNGDSIITCLKNAKGPEDCRSLFRCLGDLLLILESGSYIFLPLLFVVKASYANLDFSGVKGYKLYMEHLSDLTWKKLSKGTSEEVAQAVFHAVFGGGFEDLGVLSQITTQANWGTRQEIDAAYQTEDGRHVPFTPIRYKYISEAIPPGVPYCLSPECVFSGDKFDAVISSLEKYDSRDISVASLCSSLSRMMDRYVGKIRSGALDNVGSSAWILPDGSVAKDFVAEESGKLFYT